MAQPVEQDGKFNFNVKICAEDRHKNWANVRIVFVGRTMK
jgi:hypothetical protein